ncbi:unnamed protein product [Gongylonema pulchrum]|uniref:Transposase n=1 Tax=Gongylonema pulchrum TaxID=637853 RepID=A0A183F1P9_9BILA|nr:unnamed protein product [Gongylonema pulchrum]
MKNTEHSKKYFGKVMSVLAPPRPSSRIEVVENTIHSTDLAIRYSTSVYNTKHGYLKKSALIVAEVSGNDGNAFSALAEHQNKTFVSFFQLNPTCCTFTD